MENATLNTPSPKSRCAECGKPRRRRTQLCPECIVKYKASKGRR